MEKDIIKNRLSKVKSLNDFAKLLNGIKREEFGTSKHKITSKQLLHFSSPKIAANRYKTFHINKKSGGLREINAPRYQLGIILHMLNIVFKALTVDEELLVWIAETHEGTRTHGLIELLGVTQVCIPMLQAFFSHDDFVVR